MRDPWEEYHDACVDPGGDEPEDEDPRQDR